MIFSRFTLWEMCQYFCPFYCQIITHIPLYIYQLMDMGFVFHFLCYELSCTIFCVEIVLISLQYILGGGFRLVKPFEELPDCFQSDWTVLLPISCSFSTSSPKLGCFDIAILVSIDRTLLWFLFIFSWWIIILGLFLCIYWSFE